MKVDLTDRVVGLWSDRMRSCLGGRTLARLGVRGVYGRLVLERRKAGCQRDLETGNNWGKAELSEEWKTYSEAVACRGIL